MKVKEKDILKEEITIHKSKSDNHLPGYQIKLSNEERSKLEAMTRRGEIQARKFIHARALLLCDTSAGAPAWNVADVATAVGVTRRTMAKKRSILSVLYNCA